MKIRVATKHPQYFELVNAPPAAVCVNHGGKGIGDALLGLTVLPSVKAAHPAEQLVYKAGPLALPFMMLFEGGYDLLSHHDPDDRPLPKGDIQLNPGYGWECESKCQWPRWERYARNVGAREWTLPRLKEPDRLKALGADMAGAVVLCPFSAHQNRQWRIEAWLTLEGLLLAQDRRVLILDTERGRTGCFKSERQVDASAERVAGILLNASAVVSNDSGMAHLGGVLGVPTIVLCGAMVGAKIYGLYPSATCLQGKLTCDGCWWQAPFSRERCDSTCADLQTILPADVLAALPSAGDEFPSERLGRLFANNDPLDWLPRYAALWRIIKRLQPQRMVEIGVRAGYSAWTMLEAMPDATLLGIDADIDPAAADSHGGYKGAWKHAVTICPRLQLLIVDSHSLGYLPQADLVYIDGDHTQAGCSQDLALAWRSGARFILCDDYAVDNLGVRAAVGQFLRERPALRGELVPDGGSQGLFLITVPQ